MAAHLSSPTFTIDDKILLRLTCIHKKVATDVLRFAFTNDTKDRPQHMPLLDYYKSKGITGFKKAVNKEQKNSINLDPEGGAFDITLLYCCLRNGSCHLAPKDDDKWNAKDGNSIESLIGIVKEKRNNLVHGSISFTNKQLLDEAQELKNALIEIIKWCGKIYSLSHTVTDPKIDEIEANVNKYLYDDFDQTTFEEYKNQLFFEAQSEYVDNEGVKDLQEQYDKHYEDRISTVNHIVDLNLPLDSIYTDMKLKGESASGQEKSISYEEVLLDSGQNRTDDIIVISGVAGVGKTTFTKKILMDWRSRYSKMLHLIDHNILLKTECRNKAVKHFDDLLYNLMPRVTKYFKVNDIIKVVLHQNVLVIIDGLDELNKNSANLFEEILELKKSHKISLLITTRPEKLTYLEVKIKSHQLTTKHIELVGVPVERRAELVTKYHNAIEKNSPGIQCIGGLLLYLEKTKFRLADLWKLPYNLTFITLLWSYDYMNVAAINTAPELYREILKLYKAKLIGRLMSIESAHHLPVNKVRDNVNVFLKHLAKESLTGLKDDNINLSQEAYERLEEVCNYINLPVEELTSAFLQRLPGIENLYSFPHKGLQDYLAALYVWMEITKKGERIDTQIIRDEIAKVLNQRNVDYTVAQSILKLTKKELESQSSGVGFISRIRGSLIPNNVTSSIISNIMQEIHESREYDVSKYQNMLMYLIGLFYLESDYVPKNIKLEVLKLLQTSGVKNKEHWIVVLDSVKCDDYVASFISKQENILEGNIEITDSSASAYISLMQSLKTPLQNAHSVQINIDIKGELSDSVYKLFQLINFHKFRVRRILVRTENFKAYTTMLEELKIPFVSANRVQVEIIVDEDLINIKKLLNVIEKRGITVTGLQLKDISINDSNVQDIISAIKSLRINLTKDVNLTYINLVIETNSFDMVEVQELIMKYNFRIKRFLVTGNNYEKYSIMFIGLIFPIKDTEDIEMEININKDVTDIADFLKIIQDKGINVNVFKIQDIIINDSNFYYVIPAMKSLPHISKDGIRTGFTIDMERYVPYAAELQELIMTTHSKVKTLKILVNESNYEKYMQMLKNLTLPRKAAQHITMEIRINIYITEITDFLKEIRLKGITVAILKIRDICINDRNFVDVLSIMMSLPQISNNGNLTGISLFIERYLIDFDELRELITVNHFRVKKYLVTEHNVEQYTQMIRNHIFPLNDSQGMVMEIKINKDITGLKDFLQAIKGKDATVAYLRLSDISINESNFYDFISILEGLAGITKDSNFTDINVAIEGDLLDVGRLQELMIAYQFRVTRFIVNEDNWEKYISLMPALKGTQGIEVDIAVDKDILYLGDLLELIKVNHFRVDKFKVRDLYVSDWNAKSYCNALNKMSHEWSNVNSTAVNMILCDQIKDFETIVAKVAEFGFRVNAMSIRGKNIGHGTKFLKSRKIPLTDVMWKHTKAHITKIGNPISSRLSL